MKKKKFRQKRKLWFRGMKRFLRLFYKKPEFIYLGEKPSHGAIILSNHEGSKSPVTMEIHAEFPIRMWGVWEMNSGFKQLYKYQTRTYYHQKHGWNLHLARLFCLLASPLTNLFYRGLRLISSYNDARFFKTVTESIKVIKEDKENIVIFPEDSSEGYFKELKSFYPGFIVLAQSLYKDGIDVPIYVAYFKPKEKKFIFDAPILYSELKSICGTKEEMANYLLKRCNALGNMKEGEGETLPGQTA